MLVETEGMRVLVPVDAGLGDIAMATGAPDHGRLAASLAAVGLAPADIVCAI